jgi:hypothetical protein
MGSERASLTAVILAVGALLVAVSCSDDQGATDGTDESEAAGASEDAGETTEGPADGQQLALLGNSGNTTAPHLHFHVMDAPLELGADRNLPYVFDAFDYQGFLDAADGTPSLLTTPEAREDELPLAFSVVTFAAPEGE